MPTNSRVSTNIAVTAPQNRLEWRILSDTSPRKSLKRTPKASVEGSSFTRIRRPGVNNMSLPKGNEPWNKGLTAVEDPRILAGKDHPMYSRHHSEETRGKMSENHWSKRGIHPWNKWKILVKRIKKICPVCENFFFVLPYKNGQKYCSVECRNAIPWNRGRKCPQISKGLRGRKTWNKGLTKEIDPKVMTYAKKLKGMQKPFLRGNNNPSKRPEVIRKLKILNLGKNNPMYGKMLSLKRKQQLINANLEKRKDKEFSEEWNRKISKALKNKRKSEEHKNSLRKTRLNQIFPKKDTKIEVKLQEALKSAGIKFETHKPVLDICQADVFIRPNICIFCDGDWWHANPKFYDRSNLKSKVQIYNIKRDALHDQTLQREGYIVLRFWEDEINNEIENCVERIDAEIMQSSFLPRKLGYEPKLLKAVAEINRKIGKERGIRE